MATVSSVLNDIATLSASEKVELRGRLIKMFTPQVGSLSSFVENERFSGGMVCPVCGKTHIVRHGHRTDGVQHYLCRDCGRSFVATTNTIVAGTQKDYDVWERFTDCMMEGLSLPSFAVKPLALAMGI